MVVIKASLKNEIRRFNCEDPQRGDVFALCRQHFPELADKAFILSYVDDEGDNCTLTALSTQDEWREALNFVSSTNVLRLAVRVLDNAAGGDQVAHRAICDGCNVQISGIRYKCLVCPDYDLCAACEDADEHHTSAHGFAKLRHPGTQFWRRGPWGGRGGPFGFCRPQAAAEAAPAEGGAAAAAPPTGDGGDGCKSRGWGGHCGRRRGAWWRRGGCGAGADAGASDGACGAAAAGATGWDAAAAAARDFGIPTEWLGRAQELLASGVPLPELIAAFLRPDANPEETTAAAAASPPAAAAAATSAPSAEAPVAPTAPEATPSHTEDATPRSEQPTEDAAAPSSVRAAPEEPAAATPAATASPATGVPPFMQFLQSLNSSGVSLPELAASFLGVGRPDAAVAPAADSPAMTQALEALSAMGFADDADRRRHRALLTRYSLNVDRVVAELLSQ